MGNLAPIPLFGSGIKSISPTITAQRRLNCFWDIRKDGDKANAVLIGTPGLSLDYTLPTGPVRGWRVVGTLLYVVAGYTLYSVAADNTHTNLGSLGTGNGKVSMSDNGAQLAIVDGAKLYIYSITAGNYYATAFNTIGYFGAVADFTSQVGNAATTITFFDGRFLVEMKNSRQAYGSAVYDGTDWGGGAPPNGLGAATGYWTKEDYADNLSAIDSFIGYVVMWGMGSIEWWQDTGGSPLPYQRIQGATQRWGLGAKWSRAEVGNTMIFLGINPEGHADICQIGLSGYTPTVISTSDVSDIINDIVSDGGLFSDAVALTYSAFGHIMYQITFPSGNRTLLYDTATQSWQETQTGLDLQNRHIGELSIAYNNQNYISDSTTGNVYSTSEYVYTDNGVSIKRQLVSRHIRNGGNQFTPAEVFLDFEIGLGLQSGQGSDPQISMEKSTDNGHTFGQPRLKSMGKVGQYQYPRVRWTRNGTARDFVFRFTVTDPVRFIVTGGAVEI